MLPVETTLLMSRDGMLPKSWGKVNRKESPSYSLYITAALTNVFLLTFLVTDYAYQFAYSLCTAAILICYLLVGIYQMIYSCQQKEYTQLLIGIVATGFQIIGITLAGFGYVLLCSIAYLPGFYFYLRACKENDYQISKLQKLIMLAVSLIAILSIAALATGLISV
jgi:arginine:ornithine antiporter/lysine permease